LITSDVPRERSVDYCFRKEPVSHVEARDARNAAEVQTTIGCRGHDDILIALNTSLINAKPTFTAHLGHAAFFTRYLDDVIRGVSKLEGVLASGREVQVG
jgi:hypothetical protein